MNKLLNNYRSLSGQAEDINTHTAYKELIETIKDMSYSELHDKMEDIQIILTVLIRNEIKDKDIGGLEAQAKSIKRLCNIFLEVSKNRIEYTYEFMENKNR